MSNFATRCIEHRTTLATVALTGSGSTAGRHSEAESARVRDVHETWADPRAGGEGFTKTRHQHSSEHTVITLVIALKSNNDSNCRSIL